MRLARSAGVRRRGLPQTHQRPPLRLVRSSGALSGWTLVVGISHDVDARAVLTLQTSGTLVGWMIASVAGLGAGMTLAVTVRRWWPSADARIGRQGTVKRVRGCRDRATAPIRNIWYSGIHGSVTPGPLRWRWHKDKVPGHDQCFAASPDARAPWPRAAHRHRDAPWRAPRTDGQRIGALADTEHVIERLPNGRFDQDACRLVLRPSNVSPPGSCRELFPMLTLEACVYPNRALDRRV